MGIVRHGGDPRTIPEPSEKPGATAAVYPRKCSRPRLSPHRLTVHAHPSSATRVDLEGCGHSVRAGAACQRCVVPRCGIERRDFTVTTSSRSSVTPSSTYSTVIRPSTSSMTATRVIAHWHVLLAVRAIRRTCISPLHASSPCNAAILPLHPAVFGRSRRKPREALPPLHVSTSKHIGRHLDTKHHPCMKVNASTSKSSAASSNKSSTVTASFKRNTSSAIRYLLFSPVSRRTR
ncbi:hypothetical protein C8Q80DRAFT_218639 [Daedaleopsis nitida]|nr:hypothetical protein C8Q80DRAFT_218639 [Daedaleopsis nitida]